MAIEADKTSIAFLGMGLMGSRQAPHLISAGHRVTVWNRSPDKALPFKELGARVAMTPAEAVAGADVVITMLSRGETVAEVLFDQGAAAAMKAGAMVIDMSSIAPEEARAHAVRLEALGIEHLDAPVSGGTKGAEAATLAIMAGGKAEVFERVKPVLELMGRPLLVGPSGAGQVAKLANQMIVGITIGAVAEALVMAEKAGADPKAVRAALRGGFAESRILDLHGERMTDRDFVPGGRTSLQIKDLENAARVAEAAGASDPFTRLALDLFRKTYENHGDVDHAGLWLTLRDG
ncbi:NAD(P)-dependent oxidoreductase [Oryzibacter oryziterrae]|uniref:NAD(P)-dependent oxidoreductase n=1 Tax=Oryzibacter oryziterrae TaxID=2766474 RepID=UPI001F42A66B|nr:NAD(P)-dependent oxidoreductase [Oryzibacter oryziterrae]